MRVYQFRHLGMPIYGHLWESPPLLTHGDKNVKQVYDLGSSGLSGLISLPHLVLVCVSELLRFCWQTEGGEYIYFILRAFPGRA